MPNQQSPTTERVDGPIRVFNTFSEAQLATPLFLGQVFVTLDGYILVASSYSQIGNNVVNGYNPSTGDQTTAIGIYSAITTGTLFTGSITAAVQAIVAAGAIDANRLFLTSTIATVGAIALTLADGISGQFKFIAMITDGGDATLTPAHFANGSTIVFNDAGDSVLLQFLGGKWQVMSNYGCTIA